MASRQAIQSRVEGVEASRKALERVLRAEKAAIPQVLAVIGQQGVTLIRRYAPLQTGRLRRSYTYDVDPGGRWVDLLSNVEYAPYQEFGTVRIAGTPHVRPAMDELRREVPKLVAEGVGRAGRGAASGFGRGPAGLSAVATRLADLAA